MRVITIGRAPDNDMVLDDEYVSPHHAKLTQYDDGRVTVQDVGSTNGVFVNGYTRVYDERLIGPGDVLRIGRTVIPWTTPGGYTPTDPFQEKLKRFGPIVRGES